MAQGHRIRGAAFFFLLLLSAGCSTLFQAPPDGSAGDRERTFATLLRMEDRREYDPVLAGRAAGSPDPFVRARAARMAGALRDREASVLLPVLLRDPEASVRSAAAFAAGVSGDQRLVRHVVPVLGDGDEGTAALAAEALGKLGSPEARAALVACASAASAARRPACAQALWRSADPASLAVLAAGAASGDERLRRAAVYALARRPDPSSAPLLRTAAAAARGNETEAWAARGLGVLKDAGAIPALVRLGSSNADSPAIEALVALEKIGATVPLPPAALEVAAVRSTDPRPGVALAALRLLGRFPHEGQARTLLLAAVNGGGRRGGVALAAFFVADPDAALDYVEGPSFPEDAQLHLGAAESVASLDPARAGRLSRRLLADPSARVRATAISSLSAAAAGGAAGLLADALADPDPAVRAAALEAAAPHVDGGGEFEKVRERWDAAFSRLASDPEPDFAVSALEAAAARTARETAREEVARFADAPEATTREKARRLLVEKFGAKSSDFAPRATATRLGAKEYLEAARSAIAGTAGATTSAVVRTSRGSFRIDLVASEAPLTVRSFSTLARARFFDGTRFHRVVPDFVVQGGDPRGDGSGGPGYAIRDEINPLRYARGAVGMALSGPDTGGSQWFVTLSPQPHLDGGYTVFGRVADPRGLELLDSIEQGDVVESIRIEEVPAAGGRKP